ncbi:MAG: GNAT family N-acetyltransferase [Gammaproteobacteria bacterium]|nr:MAG: GNAT family N-acetyltransferase [Gammaproteobacteria bacterium]
MSNANDETWASRAPTSAGRLEVAITYLELAARPPLEGARPPADNIMLVRARNPTVSFYRYLYNGVGKPWLWYERRDMNDRALQAVVQHPHVEVHVLYLEGVPAGYIELDRRAADEVEIAYFGLMPEFIGRQLGRFLLEQGLVEAWRTWPKRVWVHTCSLDHSSAIALYQSVGFVPYKQETVIIDDPRKTVASGE